MVGQQARRGVAKSSNRGLIAGIVAILFLGAGCGVRSIEAGFPEVTLQQPAKPGTGPTIGLARVEDSRTGRDAGMLNDSLNLQVGAGLADYIERTFHNKLVAHGMTVVEALNPAKNPPSGHKTVVVIVQSAQFDFSGFGKSEASVNIAVQVYGSASTDAIFGGSFSGTDREGIKLMDSVASNTGIVLAAASDRAIDAAFADEHLEQALK